MPSTSATTRHDAHAVGTAAGIRRQTLRIAAAGLTAVAALTLTACGGQDGDALKTGAAKPYHPAPKATGSTGGAGESTPQGTSGARGQGAGDAQSGTRTDNAGAEQASTGRTGHAGQTGTRHACDAAKIRITAKPLTRPVNHLLLEATNTTGATCDLYAFPYLGFKGAQSPMAELPDSKPQAVVTLAPGESGYASVMTSSADGTGSNGHRVTSLSVSLPDRDGKGSVGGSAQVALPGGAAYLDDSAWVTYWQTDPSDAAAW
ncbi:DUF4232 domain-containing protein [Streptomyces sp. NPDC093589]|uniref:DUF4232 domain-containing protein n=1 Tax=Streptomyces sp. NPDC093589 TaxID=3366043 RepID=UPI003812ADE6